MAGDPAARKTAECGSATTPSRVRLDYRPEQEKPKFGYPLPGLATNESDSGSLGSKLGEYIE